MEDSLNVPDLLYRFSMMLKIPFFKKQKMDSNFKLKVEISSANGRKPSLAV